MQQVADKNAKLAADFLAQNAKQPGVQTTPSGLQYKVLAQGNGATPGLTDKVRCHYRGTLHRRHRVRQLVSAASRPSFRSNQVIPGWTEALQKMKRRRQMATLRAGRLGLRHAAAGPADRAQQHADLRRRTAGHRRQVAAVGPAAYFGSKVSNNPRQSRGLAGLNLRQRDRRFRLAAPGSAGGCSAPREESEPPKRRVNFAVFPRQSLPALWRTGYFRLT